MKSLPSTLLRVEPRQVHAHHVVEDQVAAQLAYSTS